jgi:hypothetical protein
LEFFAGQGSLKSGRVKHLSRCCICFASKPMREKKSALRIEDHALKEAELEANEEAKNAQ